MSATSLPAFLDAFVTQLQERDGLAGVAVYSCPVAPEDLGAEGIEMAAEVTVSQARAAMGSDDLEEEYEVSGSVLVYSPLSGGGRVEAVNAAAKRARDHCEELLAEIADQLADDDTADASVRDVGFSAQTWHQGMAPESQMGRVCWCEFRLAVRAHVTP